MTTRLHGLFARLVTGALGALVLSGCVTLPADLGRSDVDALLSERGLPVKDANQRGTHGTGDDSQSVGHLLQLLLAKPLSADSSVRVALLNSPRLQMAYARLGLGAAELYEAGRIRNPTLSAALLDANAPGEGDQFTLGLVTSFTDLITLPARKRIASAAFAGLKQSVGDDILHVAAEAERAYYRYVASQQVHTLRAKVAEAAGLSAALAQRYSDAGNMEPRSLAIELATASEARLDALSARAEAVAARTEFANVLGLSVEGAWTAETRLPLPLAQEDELTSLIDLARRSRLDLAAARTQAAVLADQRGVVNWSRWLGELDIGVERERETDGVRLVGPTLDWEVPIFTQHRDALLRADAELARAIAEVAQLTVGVDNNVRLAFAGVQNAAMRAKEYREALIPQRIAAVARGQEEVNYMLIGIFELLAIKQQEYDAYQGYLEAIRDYWLSRADLALAAGNSLPSSARIAKERVDVQEFVRPQEAMDHSMHGMSKESEGSGSVMDHSGHGGGREKTPAEAHQHSDKHQDHTNGNSSSSTRQFEQNEDRNGANKQ